MVLVAHIIVDVPLMQTARTNRHRYAGSCAFW